MATGDLGRLADGRQVDGRAPLAQQPGVRLVAAPRRRRAPPARRPGRARAARSSSAVVEGRRPWAPGSRRVASGSSRRAAPGRAPQPLGLPSGPGGACLSHATARESAGSDPPRGRLAVVVANSSPGPKPLPALERSSHPRRFGLPPPGRSSRADPSAHRPGRVTVLRLCTTPRRAPRGAGAGSVRVPVEVRVKAVIHQTWCAPVTAVDNRLDDGGQGRSRCPAQSRPPGLGRDGDRDRAGPCCDAAPP